MSQVVDGVTVIYMSSGDDMKKGKRPDKVKKSIANDAQLEAESSTNETELRPKTYSLMPVSNDDDATLVQMTSREVFENNCPGEDPECYDGLDEAAIYAKMFDQADRLAANEGKWHPDDAEKVAIACTDFILDSLRRNLDMKQIREGKQSGPGGPSRK